MHCSRTHMFRNVPREVSALFPVVLRGGLEPVGGADARLVEEREAEAVIECETEDGKRARFHLTGDYELIDGRERRVYDFEPPSSAWPQ